MPVVVPLDVSLKEEEEEEEEEEEKYVNKKNRK